MRGNAKLVLLGALKIKPLIFGTVWKLIAWSEISVSIILMVGGLTVYAKPPLANAILQQLPIKTVVRDNEDRITKLEVQVENLQEAQSRITDPVKTEARLVKLEEQWDTIKSLLMGIALSVGLLLIESGHRLLSRKEKV